MMLRDNIKVLILFSLLSFCLLSAFTSKSFYTKNHGVGTVRVNTLVSCSMPHAQLQQCLNTTALDAQGSTSSPLTTTEMKDKCIDFESQLKTCENVASKAYKYINLSACIRELQATSICHVEWCTNQTPDVDSCRKECKVVNEQLKDCEKEYLHRFFHRARLNPDGTFLAL